MPNRWPISSGNWSNAAIWNGSLIPTASDDVFSNNFTVNIDTSFEVLSLSSAASASAVVAGGSFNFNSGSISCSLSSATPIVFGAANAVTITAPTGTVTINCTNPSSIISPLDVSSRTYINHTSNCNFTLSVYQLNGAQFSSNNSSIVTLSKTSPGILTFTGIVQGGGAGSGGGSGGNHAISCNAGNVIINGNVRGNTILSNGGFLISAGINQTAGNLTINGNVIGGTASGGNITANYGINFSGTSLTVNGNILGGNTSIGVSTSAPTFINGNISGSATSGIVTTAPVIVSGSVIAQGAAAAINAGSSVVFINVSGSVIASATQNAIIATAATAVVNLAGNLVNVNGKQAIYCQNLFLDNTQTTQARFFTFGGSDRTLYSSDTFPSLPSSSNVRFETTYGPGSGNTGTLRMTSPQDVRSGVLTDNTTGSAILSAQSLFDEIATSTNPVAVRLRQASTTNTVGNLLTAFKK